MLTTRRREVIHVNHALCLFFQCPHDLGQSDSLKAIGSFRIPAKITYRLKMDPSHHRGKMQREFHNSADSVGIDSGQKGRHKDHAQARFSTDLNSAEFFSHKGSAPEGAVYIIIYPIKLEKNRGKAGLFEIMGVSSL
jgi:hypothetical protein